MANRKAVSIKTRFEVFKRDSFTCQYCGQSAPTVVLHLDHLEAVANGGSNDVLNLITSCATCNLGKSARKLSDHSVASKQMGQAKELSERAEQLKLIAKWRTGLKSELDTALEIFEAHLLDNHSMQLSEFGKSDFRKTIRKYGLTEVLSAAEKSEYQYLEDVNDEQQRAKFLNYIPRICYWTKMEKENPEIAEIQKIAALAQRNWWRCNRQQLFNDLRQYYKNGFSLQDLRDCVQGSTGIMAFEKAIKELAET